MNHRDVLIGPVSRNKFNQLVYKVTVKEEDYTTEDYEDLRTAWQEGITRDIKVDPAQSTQKPDDSVPTVDPQTGEINS